MLLKKGRHTLAFELKSSTVPKVSKGFWKAIEDTKLFRWEDRNGELKKVRFLFHDLWHTFGSRLGIKGFDLKAISRNDGIKPIRCKRTFYQVLKVSAYLFKGDG